MDPIALQQGLVLSAIGLVLTFATLGLMVVPIWLVNRYQEAHPPKEEPAKVESDEPVACEEPEPAVSEAEVAAAIAASIMATRRQETSPSGLGAALELGPGRWWTPSDN